MYIKNSWGDILETEWHQDYFVNMCAFIHDEYERTTIYPPKRDVFNALSLTPYEDVRVVILGQDPYHGPGQAHGLAFSVLPGVKTPPSLQNIYKELQDDLGCFISNNGYLIRWAQQGVMLLNTALTVEQGKPNSHKNIGWTTFTDAVISHLNKREKSIVFMLWGANAKEKRSLITNSAHTVLCAAHPSPFSVTGFYGCKHFSKANAVLAENGFAPVDWQIENR